MHTGHTSLRYLALVPIGFAALIGLGAAPGAGIVHSITTGFGLTGGGTGDVTLAVDGDAVQRRVSGACGAGQAIAAVASNGSVTCQPAGTPVVAFIHQATAATIPESDPGITVIDNPVTNGDPAAILIVTARVSDPGGSNVVDAHPIAVTYTTIATCPFCNPAVLDKWSITNADATLMMPGAQFNVLVVKM